MLTVAGVVVVVLTSVGSSLAGSCGTVCTCQGEQEESVECRADLDNIPNDLSPDITRLELAGNKIKYVSNMEHYMR